jgi:ATP-dependent Clp protease ATP-binding subunit ClpX
MEENQTITLSVPKPSEIKKFLDQFVIGQDEAKRKLSVAVYNHYKRLAYNNSPDREMDIDKSNIILLGSTGSGKTLMVKTIAKMLNVPCYIQDCTKITEAGYVGSDVEECLVGLLRASDYNVSLAQCGIVMLDEGDKIATKGANMSITRDVSGEGVQQCLLKIVEGDLVGVPPAGGRKHPEQKLIYVDTTNILFILSGAFVGLDKIVEKRIGRTKIGFGSTVIDVNDENVNDLVTPQDLKEFGLIPEFVGRFPVITHTNKLSDEDLVRILKEPKNAVIKQFAELLKMDQVDLTFEEEALKYIAATANELGTGARGLRTIIEEVLSEVMFDIPDNGEAGATLKVTENDVKKCLGRKFKKYEFLKESA